MPRGEGIPRIPDKLGGFFLGKEEVESVVFAEDLMTLVRVYGDQTSQIRSGREKEALLEMESSIL